MDQRQAIIKLVTILSRHQGVTHYAISMRAMRKGDFFKNMIEKGYDCRTQTADKLMLWFSENWPDATLPWPDDVSRPKTAKGDEKV